MMSALTRPSPAPFALARLAELQADPAATLEERWIARALRIRIAVQTLLHRGSAARDVANAFPEHPDFRAAWRSLPPASHRAGATSTTGERHDSGRAAAA